MTEITMYKRRLFGETKQSRNSQNCLHEGIGKQTRRTMSFELNGPSQTSSITSRTEARRSRAVDSARVTTHRPRVYSASIIWGVRGCTGFGRSLRNEQVPRREDRVQAECAAKTQEPMHKQTCSCLTTTMERLGAIT